MESEIEGAVKQMKVVRKTEVVDEIPAEMI